MCVFVYHEAEVRLYSKEIYLLNIIRPRKITRNKGPSFDNTLLFFFFYYSYIIVHPSPLIPDYFILQINKSYSN